MKKFKKNFDKFIWFITGTNADNFAYKLISFFGLLIRLVFLPFIVTCLYKSIVTKFFGGVYIPTWLIEVVTRIIVVISGFFFSTRFLNLVAYKTVGCFYSRGKKPVFGSIFYNLFYIFYQLMFIFLLGPFGWWGYGLTVAVYLIISGTAFGLGSNPFSEDLQESIPKLQKIGTYPKNWKYKAFLLYFCIVLIFICCFIVQWYFY